MYNIPLRLGLLLLPILSACTGDDQGLPNTQSSQDISSQPAMTSNITGDWLLTKIHLPSSTATNIYMPYYAQIDDAGQLIFKAPCFDAHFQQDTQTGGFQRLASPQSNACEAEAFSHQIADLIELTHTTDASQTDHLTFTGDDFTLIFEHYKPPCDSPTPWPEDELFSPLVQLSFTSAADANTKLKDFILDYEDFEITSWEQACTANAVEYVNARLNLKTLNHLRCNLGINTFEFIPSTGGTR